MIGGGGGFGWLWGSREGNETKNGGQNKRVKEKKMLIDERKK